MIRLMRCLPAAAYCILIFSISGIPGTDIPAVADDRLEHFVEYFILGILLMVAVSSWGTRLTAAHFGGAWGFAVLFALSDEWHQSFIPQRDSSLSDVLFDGLGATAALVAIAIGLMTRRGPHS